MGLSRVVASVAVLPTALGIASFGFIPYVYSFVLFHVAATGFAISVAASDFCPTETASMLGKYKDGKIRLWGKLLFWPFHLGIRIRLSLKRMRSREPLFDEIMTGWYVGGWPSKSASLPPGDPSVIDCTCEYPKVHNTDRYLCLLIWDTHGATAEQLKLATDWAKLQNDNGYPVYIHCAHGHGRSVAVLVACFIKMGISNSIEEAEAMIKTIRPRIKLNSRQKKNVKDWMKLENCSQENQKL